MTNYWSRTCRTPKHLVELYQASIKKNEKGKSRIHEKGILMIDVSSLPYPLIMIDVFHFPYLLLNSEFNFVLTFYFIT
jgi:hypothetical protein